MATANTKVTLLCPIEKVWNKVTDLKDFSWRSDLEDIKIIDENNFIEITKNGIKTNFRVTEFRKHKIWAFEIENENIKGKWIGKFYSQGNNTTLDFTENIIAKKVIFKPFVGLYLRKQQKIYFQDLKRELNCSEASFVQYL
ncbi:MAG TPA: SRPBCC family protein [Spirochaetota bacterium]|nr:SRPBCC family protein [Spirochaetota bacterium]HOS32297.1 SRPBCC family protein [Spirochaetota bacterium]HOS54689.1 SRPBCC family protein [Spirochaetota bacterium]HQF77291.1 SRPBCC family protein [Spirochaetota bacterium]HQH29367.1 SRPBCC family protein [Spirochaetota bacterium]